MTEAIETARAMIALLGRSSWREVHVRTARVEMFLARSGGGANPMRAGAAVAVPAPTTIVTAPHVATFLSAVPVGSRIATGETVCRLDLLGETIQVPAGAAGTLAAVEAAAGDLVEFGTPLVRMRED